MPTSTPAASPSRSDSQACAIDSPIDVASIDDTLQSIRSRLYPPEGEAVTALMDRVCGHIGLLLVEPLGPEDAQRYVMLHNAKESLAGVPQPGEPDAYRWRYVMSLAADCEALLRRWITYVQPEGDYQVRCEPNGIGYYVMDSVSGCIASQRVDGIARPARHLSAAEAAAFAGSLNDAREIHQPQPAGRPQ
ncbi:hypothetical protein DMB38_25935 [Streptomyces sp. WAC 06738]|uniref:hypothetical protein n=1 Tax=Streptomyces sp. WAC 06738 TaxID=2203210 RepID=UPI000F6F1B59|nr:hypothetical protein [Streptomyces sp. WAC 06738]AZM48759.1 hypothetical protein DMB38_25935 [Streptomyces sp. WAC 06738]